ncbi:alpha/beta hydrolase [Wenzhouxiangella limi]|uniref:Alpha/beta hydrolase n=1 Tax=Wenzhouxiangella limi TaxID=2707351 RepID=A0A845URL1_9GAMM|nr:alpha/beta hydrolase [Wenzhouxiangella limi]NDY94207.1 alpha/beta hydrolase [Wenzhouxiangella limi]
MTIMTPPPFVRPLILATLMALLTACSGTSILNVLNNAEGYRSQHNVAYGAHERQKLDIYQPAAETGQCVVMFVYGGSWEEGSKQDYGFVGAALARRGYSVIIPDYRLYPQVTYPVFVEDIALALASAPVQQRLRSRKLVMMGHSAGAMIAGLVSYNPDYLQARGLSRDMIDAYVTLAGPHDYFLPTDKHRWTRIFGEDQDQQIKALTVNHIHPDNPPTLIIHAKNDETVTPKSAHSLAENLSQAGVPSTKLIYDSGGHVGLAAAMGRPLGFLAPTLDDVDAFMQDICRQD